MKTLTYSFLLTLITVYNAGAQKVGIGTSTPSARLHVVSPDSNVLLIQNTQSLNSNISNCIHFKTGTSYAGAIKSIGTGTDNARLGFFTFSSYDPNALKERLSITDAGNVGINSSSPTATLDINGTLRIRGGNPGEGRVLVSDANGNASWQAPSYFKVSGLKGLADVEFTTNRSYIKLLFNYTTEYNSGFHYDFTTSIYNAAYDGIYHFDVGVTSDMHTDEGCYLRLIRQRNGVNTVVAETGTVQNGSLSADLKLNANDKVWVEFRNDLLWVGTPNPNRKLVHNMAMDFFSGHLVQPL